MHENTIRRLVIDLLKPLEASLIEISKSLSELKGVNGVNIVVYEIDRKTETLKATIEGENIIFDEVKDVLEKYGVVIHSLDEVATGKVLVEEIKIPSDQGNNKNS